MVLLDVMVLLLIVVSIVSVVIFFCVTIGLHHFNVAVVVVVRGTTG